MDGKSSKLSVDGTAFRILAVFLVCSAFIGFSYRYVNETSDQQAQIKSLERTVNDLRHALNVDSIRYANIQKILSIIDRFNPRLASTLKYQIANEINEMSLKYANLDIDLICATITQESGRTWDPKVVSPAGAMGLMQIMPLTAMYVSQLEGITWTSAEDILFDPIYNIRLGCRYLSSMISAYDIDGGLAAYNGGERIASLWLKSNRNDRVLWRETREYVPSVLKLYEEYRSMN